MSAHSAQLREHFGEIDIYLFDQLLKGRFDAYRTVLDAGCGAGRNLVWFLRERFEVFAVDRDERSVLTVRQLFADLAPHLPPERVQRAEVESLPYADAAMDAVLSSAVLHFARDLAHFDEMVNEMWRVLRPGGLFFARLATTIGIEDRVQPLAGGRYRLPDGTTRFLMDEARLLERTDALGATLADPLRTTNVQNLRAMTTWCLLRPA
ncbi:MAG TPA: class I SAM-dependent methyltransferase [Longimicrobium sp.]|jgi:SAM-dependent methyltransferase|uniref:class I SAM-dependent methyltransferase n=1 Tax=Longimicrobium sp. TaxID=2029185 RepID=UPI002EDA38DD